MNVKLLAQRLSKIGNRSTHSEDHIEYAEKFLNKLSESILESRLLYLENHPENEYNIAVHDFILTGILTDDYTYEVLYTEKTEGE